MSDFKEKLEVVIRQRALTAREIDVFVDGARAALELAAKELLLPVNWRGSLEMRDQLRALARELGADHG